MDETTTPGPQPAESEAPTPKATDQLRSHSATVRDDLRQLGRLTKDVAQEKLDDARRTAGDLYDQGRRRANDLEDQLVEYVREKPLKSMLIAAGVGVLLGVLWSKR
jgi:ElaB/YqjD/DUF883 family membrane-anchored ribosome-binding protein